ncbi:s-adenosylmethionine-dependent methyltransferase, putative [Ichthyophthirius multifiliis]|uniref:S-adenosylmethionine-dependent methyltransferase, putative n=1 Tax=Ichthyophthirius multifiliis TaxID=5932 RepID=G0R3T7_ICHMU|nr:s-adenosylmethionine-dependent methyltransferase, putative [Ichthyophthirius multifiliis]EGR27869.1 s-adenosylmethionine-dependent methyltransferase, putative [Ichthyophthirius multifiliis]|eukprot:XP_004027214.1 s-adenosylmethionine-dependent methyltransferase, putative [Ichthyophthirius multifiliis]
MEDNFDANLFINREYVLKKFQYKDCEQEYQASVSCSTDWDLTGQIVWRAAEQLAEFIVDNKEAFKNKTCLELGAGVGLSGLVCSQYAKQVYITDATRVRAGIKIYIY